MANTRSAIDPTAFPIAATLSGGVPWRLGENDSAHVCGRCWATRRRHSPRVRLERDVGAAASEDAGGSEYFGEVDPATHAAATRSRGEWIVGLMDPGAYSCNQADGYRLMQTYRDLGLRLEAVENPLESGY